MENDLKIPTQYWAGNPLRGPARGVGGLFRGARRPVLRVGRQARLGYGLAARARAPAARSPRSGQRGGGTAVGPMAVSRQQDSPESTSGAPGCRRAGGGGGGAHPNGGTAERQRRGLGAAALVGGEGSPVVTGVVEEVLQLGRGEGVRKLQEIPGIGSSGKSSPGRGERQRRSTEIHEGEAGSGGRRWWSGCGEWRGGSSARESGRRGVKNRVSDGAARGGMRSAAARLGGEKGEGRGGPGCGGATWRAGERRLTCGPSQ
jgi:hypothetical protein